MGGEDASDAGVQGHEALPAVQGLRRAGGRGMRWIRLWGLAAFVAALGCIIAAWFLFVDGAVRCAIERTGTRLVGARGELDGADLKLFPAGLTLTGLKVTTPDEPMRNAFEAGRMAF